MFKKFSRLQLKDITETKKRLGQYELSEAKLKLVTGGLEEAATSTACCDCD